MIARARIRKPDWSDLPLEILSYIFTFMSLFDRLFKATEVCKSWRVAALDSKSFKSLDLSEIRKFLNLKNTTREKKDQLLRLTFQRGVNIGRLEVTKLVFDGQCKINNRQLRFAYKRCPNLQELCLQYPGKLTYAALKKACHFWPMLKTLMIEFNGLYSPDSTLNMVGNQCPNLTNLKFSCYILREETLNVISKSMSCLKMLNIHCTKVSTDLAEAFASIQNLEELYLSNENVRPVESFRNFPDLQAKIENGRRRRGLAALQMFHVCYREECKSCPNQKGPSLRIYRSIHNY